MLTIFGWNFEIWAVQKYVNLVDLAKSYLLAKIGVDTAENEPLEVWLIFKNYYSILFIRFLSQGAAGWDARARLQPLQGPLSVVDENQVIVFKNSPMR